MQTTVDTPTLCAGCGGEIRGFPQVDADGLKWHADCGTATPARAHRVEKEPLLSSTAWLYVALVLAVLVPIFGAVYGVIRLAKSEISPGLALWGAAAVGVWLAVALGLV